ncbi:hypothetical protein D9M71_228250 [compost metagenome]
MRPGGLPLTGTPRMALYSRTGVSCMIPAPRPRASNHPRASSRHDRESPGTYGVAMTSRGVLSLHRLVPGYPKILSSAPLSRTTSVHSCHGWTPTRLSPAGSTPLPSAPWSRMAVLWEGSQMPSSFPPCTHCASHGTASPRKCSVTRPRAIPRARRQASSIRIASPTY